MHDSEIDGGRRLHLLDEEAMRRKISVKPVIEAPVQTECEIRIRRAIAHRFRIQGRQLIEMPPCGHRIKGRKGLAAELAGQPFESAFHEGAKLRVILQGELAGTDRVIDRREDDEAAGIQHAGFKGDIVGNLDPGGGDEFGHEAPEGLFRNVRAVAVGNRDIDARTLPDGEAAAADMRPGGVEGCLVILTVGIVRRGLQVEGDDRGITDVGFDGFHIRDQLVICLHMRASILKAASKAGRVIAFPPGSHGKRGTYSSSKGLSSTSTGCIACS